MFMKRFFSIFLFHCLCLYEPGKPDSLYIGDITQVDTTGASAATAAQDHLPPGVNSSKTMARHDIFAMNKYKAMIKKAGFILDIDPAVIAGIISRESRAGKALLPSGYGHDGHGFGLMQVDDRYHKLRGGPYSFEHIMQGTDILRGMIKGISRKFHGWTENMDLKGGICAYNCGVGNVRSYTNIDSRTTGRDYSNDVVARAQYYKQNGY